MSKLDYKYVTFKQSSDGQVYVYEHEDFTSASDDAKDMAINEPASRFIVAQVIAYADAAAKLTKVR
jgi:hypothetical protein